MGWNNSIQNESKTIKQRMHIGQCEIKAITIGLLILTVIFIIGCWLATNPLETTQRILSPAIINNGLLETNQWHIIWSIVLLALVFEFLDSVAGMGYGTAFTPLLFLLGYEPLQIIPVIMIQQACAGLITAYIHKAYGNIEWHFKPMSETVHLWLIISITGILAVIFSITSVYGMLKPAAIWIKLYVVILLIFMGIIALFNAKKTPTYHSRRMIIFGALAGFNKGIGGGGYGPVVTIGGLLSGIPVKSMIAVTAFSEGAVCIVSIMVWFLLLKYGVVIDFILLPSMILGSIFAIIAAPYMTRVLPAHTWRFIVPIYCCILACFCLWQLLPELMK
jgi:uncharacterized membrane protein YfcA